jgi:protein TonB
MNLVFSAPETPRDQLSFSIKRKDVQLVLSIVVGIHLTVFLLGIFGLPNFRTIKRPDVTIELSASPTPSNAPSNQVVANPAPQKLVPKEKPKTVIDENAPAAPRQQTQESSPTPPAASSAGGPAAAPTVDADYKAAYLQNPKPPYPPLAFRLRAEGKVVLIAEVLPNGQSGSVKIVESSGNEMLDKSALETVKKWKFTPARKDGVIVTQAVRIPITFSLKNR